MPLTLDGALALAIAGLALLLFLWNRFRMDVVALAVLVAVIVTGVLPPARAVSGFAHEATITVALMLALAAGLLRTGAVAALTQRLIALSGQSEARTAVVLVLTILPVSAFINNTAAIAVLLPVVMAIGRSSGTAPSRLLMPISFAGQLGGTLTLIGTSTNLLVAGMAMDLGTGRIRLFDITAPASIVAAAGVLYLLTVGRLLLPRHAPETGLLERYELHDYLAAVRVLAGSALVGRSLGEARFGATYGLQIMMILRDSQRLGAPTSSTVLRAGDVLLVEGTVARLAAIQHGSADLAIADVDPDAILEREHGEDDVGFAELLVPARSRAVGRNVRDLALRGRFGVSALAVRRRGSAFPADVGELRLQAGDMLLVRAAPEPLRRLQDAGELVLLGALDVPRLRPHRMRAAIAIMAGVVLLPAFGVTTIMVSALGGVLAMLLTRCIEPDEIYRDMDWMVLVLLGAMLPLGEAVHTTGAAAWLAGNLIYFEAIGGEHGMLLGVLLLSTVLTSIISNAAAAAVLTPIAIALASAMDCSPMPLLMGVMIGASNSFLSPVGYQTNAMIFGPGGYRVTDYVRVGAPLTLIVVVSATLAIPLFFPF